MGRSKGRRVEEVRREGEEEGAPSEIRKKGGTKGGRVGETVGGREQG